MVGSRQTFSSAIERLVARRWRGLPDADLGGFDGPGFTIATTAGGKVKVYLGCDDGQGIGFQMEAAVARSFFERGVAAMDAASAVGEQSR